jgi:hypothetical protein
VLLQITLATLSQQLLLLALQAARLATSIQQVPLALEQLLVLEVLPLALRLLALLLTLAMRSEQTKEQMLPQEAMA